MIRYLSTLPLSPDASFLDVGTGNGHLLFELREADEEYSGRMVGIDYSPASVKLANAIAEQRALEVQFEVVDIIKDDLASSR